MILFIILLVWCGSNTILWIKSNEPYDFRVHFLFIPFMFSNFFSFKIWCKETYDKIKQSFNQEFYYRENYIKLFLTKKYREEFKQARVYDIQVRLKDGYQIHIYAIDYYRFKELDMEITLFNELRQKCTIHIHYPILKTYV
jgi:hypothetical protein